MTNQTDISNVELAERIDTIVARLTAIEDRINTFLIELQPILEEAIPMIERIQSSPTFRMLTGGKKR